MTEIVLEHMKPWPDQDRITAWQAQERMAAGLNCLKCEAANKKLVPWPGRNGWGCSACVRERKKEQREARRDG